MGLTNWQLFFRDLQNAVQDQPVSDNEVITLVRQISDQSIISDSLTPVTSTVEHRVGFAIVGYSEVG